MDKVKTDLVFDDQGNYTVRHTEVVDDVLDQAAAIRAELGHGKGIRRKNGNIQGGAMGRHIAEVPQVFLNKMREEGIMHKVPDGRGGWAWVPDPVKFRVWLNNPDNKKFRTGGGKV